MSVGEEKQELFAFHPKLPLVRHNTQNNQQHQPEMGNVYMENIWASWKFHGSKTMKRKHTISHEASSIGFPQSSTSSLANSDFFSIICIPGS